MPTEDRFPAVKRRTYLAAVGATGSGALAGCLVPGFLESNPCADADCDVGMTRTSFVPDEIEVTTGETVVWKNTSDAWHTVTAYEGTLPEGAEYFATGGYESERAAREAWERGEGALNRGETFEHTFVIPGDYGYVCIPHEPTEDPMVGIVRVRE